MGLPVNRGRLVLNEFAPPKPSLDDQPPPPCRRRPQLARSTSAVPLALGVVAARWSVPLRCRAAWGSGPPGRTGRRAVPARLRSGRFPLDTGRQLCVNRGSGGACRVRVTAWSLMEQEILPEVGHERSEEEEPDRPG